MTFQLMLKNLPPELKLKWQKILDTALTTKSGKPSDEFSKTLLFIRNNIAFHYYQSGKNLSKGFIDFFYKNEKNVFNEHALYALGDSMRNTRFFYCDGAVQEAMARTIANEGGVETFYKKLGKVMTDINQTIKAIMANYLSKK